MISLLVLLLILCLPFELDDSLCVLSTPGVKHVELEGNATDEVKVTDTMDVPAMVAYLTEKLNRAVEAVAPGKKDKGGSGDGGGPARRPH